MNVDLKISTVELAGRRFPACVLICPIAETDPRSAWDRTLGLPWVYIPLESGILVGLEEDTRGLECRLYSRTCEFHSSENVWLPHWLGLHGRRIIPGWQWWSGCEEEWLVEHIDRISTFAYEQPPGPLVELRRLADEPVKLQT